MPASPPPNMQQVFENAKLFVRRTIRSDFQREKATDAERQALRVSPKPIEEPLAQDYAAWRRAALWIATAALALTVIVKMIDWIHTLAQDPSAFVQSMVGLKGGLYDVPPQVARAVNILKFTDTLLFLSTCSAAVLACLAALRWNDLRRSRRFARAAWGILFLTPFVLALIPWPRFVDTGPIEQNRELASVIGTMFGLTLFANVAPAAIALCSGIIRSSLTLKTLIPESPAPGWATAFFAPIYAIILLSLFVMVNQTLASLMLVLGTLGLIAAPFVYIWHARDVLRAHSEGEVTTVLGAVRRKAILVGSLGAGLLVLYALESNRINVFDVLRFFVTILGSFLLLSVVGADFILAMLFASYRQSKEFHGSELSRILDRKFATLESVGLTRLHTRSMTEYVPLQR